MGIAFSLSRPFFANIVIPLLHVNIQYVAIY